MWDGRNESEECFCGAARLLPGGSCFAGREGNLRTPCIVRWPGRIPQGRVSDEIMHVTDWCTTTQHAAGLREASDRVIDGVSQLDGLTGDKRSSARDEYIY